MKSDWPAYAVHELQDQRVLLVEDGNHGEYRPKTQEFGAGETAFIRAVDMSDGIVHFESADRINDEAVARIRKGVGRGGDILFSHKGTVGKLALVPMNAPPFVCSPQTTFWRTLDENRLDRRYLFYFMRSRAFTVQWRARRGETDMADYVSLTAQRQLRVALPEIEVQRAIGALLGAFDDKIDVLHEMNRTMEAIARAFFRSWFVDFDPVVAKAADRQPFGVDTDTATLFPSDFEDSPLGRIPAHWKLANIGTVANNPRRGIHPSEIDPAIPYVGLAHMPRRSIVLADWGSADRITSGKFQFLRGEILFGKLRPYFHKVGAPATDGVCSTDILVIAPKSPEWFGFLLCHLSSDEFVAYTDTVSTGTKMPRTNWKDMARYEIAAPSEGVAAAFDRRVRPLVDRIHANIPESRALAAARDALLPRLYSGEIRVGEAEKAVRKVL